MGSVFECNNTLYWLKWDCLYDRPMLWSDPPLRQYTCQAKFISHSGVTRYKNHEDIVYDLRWKTKRISWYCDFLNDFAKAIRLCLSASLAVDCTLYHRRQRNLDKNISLEVSILPLSFHCRRHQMLMIHIHWINAKRAIVLWMRFIRKYAWLIL